MLQNISEFRSWEASYLFIIVCATFLILSTATSAEEGTDFDVAETSLVNKKTIKQHLDEISRVEIKYGPQHERISEHLISLSKLYQNQGEHLKRLETLKQALHIHRLNYGLESEEQLEIIEQLISTNNNLEDWMALDQNYEYFYWVSRRVHGTDSLDLLPALNRIMEWKLTVLRKGLFGHPEIIKHQATDLLRKIRKIRKINDVDKS